MPDFDPPRFRWKDYLIVNAVPWTVFALSVGLPLPSNGKILNIPSLCPFHNYTGIPCPGCGLTRAFVSCGHGHFAEAFMYHPAGVVLFLGLVGYLLFSFKPRLLNYLQPYVSHLGIAAVVMLLSVWGVRMSGRFPWP